MTAGDSEHEGAEAHRTAERRLAEAFKAGAIERDGRTVGAWYVAETRTDYETETERFAVHVAFRDVDGQPASHVALMDAPPRDLGEALAHPRERNAPGFGRIVMGMRSVILAAEDAKGDSYRSWIRLFIAPGGRAWDAVGPVAAAHHRRVAAVLDRFVSTLDTALMERVDHERQWSRFSHVWDGVDRTFRPDAPLLAALEDQPQAADLLIGMWRIDPAGVARDVARGSVRASIPRYLTHVLRVPPHVAKRYEAVRECFLVHCAPRQPQPRRQGDWLISADAPTCIFEGFASLPGSRLPRGDDLRWYLGFLGVIEDVRRQPGDLPFADALGLEESWLGRTSWAAWGRELQRIVGGGPDVVQDRMSERFAMTGAFAEQVLTPAAYAADPRPATFWASDDLSRGYVARLRRLAGQMLFGGTDLPGSLRLLEPWRAARDAIAAALPEAPKLWWWPDLPDWSEGDLALVMLRGVPEIEDEGSPDPDAAGRPGLGRNFGHYIDRCIRGEIRIASIRRVAAGDGFERLSIVALHRRSHAPRFDVYRHGGRKGADPPPEAEAFLERYIARHRAELTRFPPSGTYRRPDPSDAPREEWSRAMAAWRPLLPGPLRDLRPEDIARRLSDLDDAAA